MLEVQPPVAVPGPAAPALLLCPAGCGGHAAVAAPATGSLPAQLCSAQEWCRLSLHSSPTLRLFGFTGIRTAD